MKLSIIIPCYNERNTLKELINRVISLNIYPWEKEIIVVDDASTDDTRDILNEFKNKITTVFLDKNNGKGTAVKLGLEKAKGDYFIIQDADLEYNPNEIPLFLNNLEKDSLQVVYGSRNLHHVKRKGFIHQRLGVWFITKLINVFYDLKLTDVWTCYKLFPRSAKDLFVPGRFEAELLFTTALARAGYAFKEVPITHTPRDDRHGKKIRSIDGFRAIQLIISERLLYLRKPQTHIVSDYFKLVCCPFCRGNLSKNNMKYSCQIHGLFEIDKSNRAILIEENIYKKNSNQHESGINWLKSFFKQFPKIYYSIWHLFCPAMMLVNGPRIVLKYIKNDDIAIDVGSGPERLGKEFINVDIFPFPEVDIVADATQLPFRDNSVNAAVSESLFEHVPDASLVAKEMVRIVKSGGVVYVSAPFIHPYHASPDDFNRWTISGLKYMFPDLEIIKTGVRSGPWSALLLFMAYWLGVIFSFGSRKIAPFLAHIFMLILGPLKYLDYFFMKIPGSEVVATHLYILGRKK